MGTDYDCPTAPTGRGARSSGPRGARRGTGTARGETPPLAAALRAVEEKLSAACDWNGDWAERLAAAEAAAEAIEALPGDCSDLLGYTHPVSVAAELRLSILAERRHNGTDREAETDGPSFR